MLGTPEPIPTGRQMGFDIEDFEALRRYLTQRGHIRSGESTLFKKLSGGISNRTVRVTCADGRAWVLKQALAKLRTMVDWVSDPERIQVEAKALRWLNRVAPPGTTPAFVFEDTANHLLAMEAIPEEHENWKTLLLSGQIVLNHFQQSGFLLGTIHRQSSQAGLDLCREFAETSYFESLRLDPYYLYTSGKIPAAAGFLNALAQEALHHKVSLVHGDFSPKNILVLRGTLILLDYEVVHFGDPAFDLGFAFAHFLSKAHHLRNKRAHLADAAELFWHSYWEEIASLEWSNIVESRAVRHSLACLLARVAGKSPLEYLAQEEVVRQRDIILKMIAAPPVTVPTMIAEFVRGIENHAKN